MEEEIKKYTALLNAVREIQNIKIENEHTINEIFNSYFEILRKNGIRQGNPVLDEKGNIIGNQCDSTEWTICKDMFIKRFEWIITFNNIIGDNIPEDLLSY